MNTDTSSPRWTLRQLIPAALLSIGYGLLTRLIFGADFADGILSTMSYGFLCLVPVAIGALMTYLRRDSLNSTWDAFTVGWIPASLFLLGVIAVNLEASICIVMIAPVYMLVASIGSTIMYALLRSRAGRSRSTQQSVLLALLVAPYLFTPVEEQVTAPVSLRVVSNEIIIDAPPDIIWENIVRVPTIMPSEQRVSFFNLLGIPQPVEATMTGEGIGGVRHAAYANGLRFTEVITDWQPMRRLSFTIDADNPSLLPPPFTQIEGAYFEVVDGTYEMETLADGRVRLSLWSTHRLSTRFNFYGGLWTDAIMYDLQDYILQIVKARAEAV
jgi:hypothetical protein